MKTPINTARNAYQVYRRRKLLLPMVADALKGKYRFSLFTLLVLILCLVYVIFPFDMLPDFIPFIGWIDDGILLFLLLQQLKKETLRYQQHKEKKVQVVSPNTRKVNFR